jgi:hypothetical protein
MLLESNSIYDFELMKILNSSRKYDIVRENLNLVNNYFLNENSEIVMTIDESEEITDAAEKFVDDVKDNLDAMKEEIKKTKKSEKVWAYIGVGLTLLSMVIAIPTQATVVMGAIFSLLGLAAFIVSITKSSKLKTYINKLNDYKKKLIVHLGHAKSDKIKTKIQFAINKIDDILEDAKEGWEN